MGFEYESEEGLYLWQLVDCAGRWLAHFGPDSATERLASDLAQWARGPAVDGSDWYRIAAAQAARFAADPGPGRIANLRAEEWARAATILGRLIGLYTVEERWAPATT